MCSPIPSLQQKSLTQRYAAWQSEFESVWGHIWPWLGLKENHRRASSLISGKFTGRTEIGIENKIYLGRLINLDSCTTLEIHIFMVNVSKILTILITGMCYEVMQCRLFWQWDPNFSEWFLVVFLLCELAFLFWKRYGWESCVGMYRVVLSWGANQKRSLTDHQQTVQGWIRERIHSWEACRAPLPSSDNILNLISSPLILTPAILSAEPTPNRLAPLRNVTGPSLSESHFCDPMD